MTSHHDKPVEINIDYTSEERKIGEYADVTRVSFSPYTVSLDFAQAIIPQVSSQRVNAKIISRIVMSPGHALAFYNILGANLQNYQSQFGEIKIFEPTPPPVTK